MLLVDYRSAVRDLLHDPNANFYSNAQVDRWINRARRQVAQKGRCVRRMPPTNGSISGFTITNGGAGYTTATAVISQPDYPGPLNVQATATVTVGAGQVTGFTITNAGVGYVAPPTVTITGDGTGATATPTVTNHVCTITNQEVYNLADLAALNQALTPGLGDMIGIQSISVAWGSMKPTLARRDFSWIQMYLRSQTMNFSNYPIAWAPYGQGVAGSFYLWPRPSAYLAMEIDTYWDVIDISIAQTADLIPEPWLEPVYYYAANLAFSNAQRFDDARTMLGEHERLMTQARAATTTDVIPDPYGDGAGWL